MNKAWKKYFKNSRLQGLLHNIQHYRKLAFNAGYKAGEADEWNKWFGPEAERKGEPKRNPKVTCGSDVNML